MVRKSRRTAARAIVGALAANLAIAAIVAGSQAGPGYLAVTDWSAVAQGQNGVRLTVSTNGQIPKRPDAFIGGVPVVGFAWVDAATGKALVATIHPVIGRDSHQRPDSWHLHTVTLALGGATAPNDACVVSIDSTPTAGINIQGSQLSINLTRSSMPSLGGGERLGPEAVDLATGFTLNGDAACTASGLGVLIRT